LRMTDARHVFSAATGVVPWLFMARFLRARVAESNGAP
jgi:hypothetical protein